MVKGIIYKNGKKILLLGLSFKNLDHFRAKPLDTFIPVDGAELGLDHDILIVSGKTEADIEKFVRNAETPSRQ